MPWRGLCRWQTGCAPGTSARGLPDQSACGVPLRQAPGLYQRDERSTHRNFSRSAGRPGPLPRQPSDICALSKRGTPVAAPSQGQSKNDSASQDRALTTPRRYAAIRGSLAAGVHQRLRQTCFAQPLCDRASSLLPGSTVGDFAKLRGCHVSPLRLPWSRPGQGK